MKILIVRTYPDIMDIHAYNVQEIGLAKALVMKGHQCDIVLYYGNNKSREETYVFTDAKSGRTYSYKIYWLRGFNLVKNGFMFSLKNIISQYDLIQVDEYDLIYSWVLYTRQRKPTVIYHGLYQSDYTKGYNLKCAVFDKLFLPIRPYRETHAIAKSKMAGEFLKKKGFENVYPVGVGIDKDNFEQIVPAEKQREFFSTKRNYRLLYVGKIEERRNSLWMLDVFDKILKRGIDVQLLVVGNGSKEYMQKFLSKADPFLKEGSMIYLPKATQQELAQIYPQSDLFLFPSNYEIFGMVLLEAMYFKIPVISSYNGGSSVLIQNDENGIIIPDFDMDKWTGKISQLLLNQKKRSEMGNKAGKTIREKFLWEKLCDEFIQVYESAIQKYNEEHIC